MAAQVPNIFVEQYDQGQKKIRADLMDENFAYICTQLDANADAGSAAQTTAEAAQATAEAAQATADSKVTAAEAANAAMPSTQSISLSLPASGGSVTAPADGYIRLTAKTGASQTNGYAGLGGGPFRSWYGFPLPKSNFFVTIPVYAGQNVNVVYNITGGSQVLEFFYANGSTPTN